jgi:hypothetical protein
VSLSDNTHFAVSYWNANNYTSDVVYSCVKVNDVADPTRNGIPGPCILIAASSNDGVCCLISPGASPQLQLSYWDSGSQTDTTPNVSFTAASPIWVGIQRTSATAFACYTSTNGTSWTQIIAPRTIPGISDNGSGGLITGFTQFTTSADLTIAAWEMGPGSLPTGGACGTNGTSH